MLRIMMNVELPFGRGKRFGSQWPAVLNLVAGGWGLTPLLQYETGAPLALSASAPCASNCWNGSAGRPERSRRALTTGTFDIGKYDARERQLYGQHSAEQKPLLGPPPPLTLGTASFNYSGVREFGVVNEDVSLHKTVKVAEKYRVQLRADFLNLFNRHAWATGSTRMSLTRVLAR